MDRGWHLHSAICARALVEHGELDEALTVAREAVKVFSGQGFLWVFLTTVALLALKRGHANEAALVLGRADAAQAWRDVAPPPATMQERQDLLHRLRKVVSDSELKRLVAVGATLTDEEATRRALAE